MVHCNLVNNDYQQDSRMLYTFVPNKTFGSLLESSPTNQVFLKTFNSEFQEVKIWFTDQTSKPLELELELETSSTRTSCDDDKKIVTSDRITSYPYGYILKN